MKLDFKHKCLTLGIIFICVTLYILCFILFPSLYSVFTSVIAYAGLITLLVHIVFVHKLEEVPKESKLVHNISIVMCALPLMLMMLNDRFIDLPSYTLLIAGIVSIPFQVRLLNVIIHRDQTRA